MVLGREGGSSYDRIQFANLKSYTYVGLLGRRAMWFAAAVRSLWKYNGFRKLHSAVILG